MAKARTKTGTGATTHRHFDGETLINTSESLTQTQLVNPPWLLEVLLLHSASLHKQQGRCIIRRFHSRTCCQFFEVLGVPSCHCHVKEGTNCKKCVASDVKLVPKCFPYAINRLITVALQYWYSQLHVLRLYVHELAQQPLEFMMI